MRLHERQVLHREPAFLLDFLLSLVLPSRADVEDMWPEGRVEKSFKILKSISSNTVQIQFKQHVRDCSGAPKFCTLKKMTLARSTGYLCGCRTSSTQRLSQHCWWETLWAWVSCNHQRVKSGWRRQQLFQPLWNTLIKQESHVGKVVHGSNLLRYWDKKPWGS